MATSTTSKPRNADRNPTSADHANLAKSRSAPRCNHIRYNGQRCAAPARSGSDYCIFHGYEYEGRVPTTTVPEDAASVQLELGRVIRQLQDNQIPTKSAALILYALQIASHNLKRLHDELPFDPPESVVPEHIDQFFDELKRLLADERDSSAPKPAQSTDGPVEERLSVDPRL